MKRQLQILFLLSITLLPLMLFQNCAKGFEANLDLPMAATASTPGSGTGAGSVLDVSPKENPFICADPNQQGITPLQRLTREQYSNSVLSALGAELHAHLKDSISTLRMDTLSKNVRDFGPLIDDEQMQAYQAIAEKASLKIQGSPQILAELAGACISQSPVSPDCKTGFINNLGKKMFRRPLRAAELTKFSSLIFDKGDGAAESVALTVYAMMISPDFLIRLELGDPSDTGTATSFNLSPYEVASRLSFLLWNSPPDKILLSAADSNQLSSPSQISDQFDRMMTDPRARAKMRDFFRFWLDPRKSSATSFATDFLAGFDVNSANTEFEREMYEFIDYVIFQKNGTFQDLLQGSESFARTDLVAQVYGHSAVTGNMPSRLAPVRKGLLMRAPVIATDGNETHPILRGVKFKRRFLCDTLGLPSGIMTNDLTFFSDAARLKASTRARTAGLTSSTTCMACHSSINPLGFSFENFDGIGRVRVKEQSYSTLGNRLAEFPIETRVEALIIEPGTSFATNDGTEVIDRMLEGSKVPACFIKQIYRYYQIKEEGSADNCQLKSMYEKIKSANYNNKPLLSVFKEFFVYPAIFKRSI